MVKNAAPALPTTLTTHGLTFGLFGLVWVVGLNYCPNEPCNYQQTSDSPEKDAQKNIWHTPDAIRGTFSYEAEPEYREGNPTRYEYYDLRAQERIAHATDWIAWITFASAGIGVFDLGALIATLFFQREATKIRLVK